VLHIRVTTTEPFVDLGIEPKKLSEAIRLAITPDGEIEMGAHIDVTAGVLPKAQSDRFILLIILLLLALLREQDGVACQICGWNRSLGEQLHDSE
jgi:hypothetical protein